MSVICLSDSEIGDLCTTILFTRRYEEAVKTLEDRSGWDQLKGFKNSNEVEYWQTVIKCWMQRLSISNQLAFKLSYQHDDKPISVEGLTDKTINQGRVITDKKAFLKQLSSLEYNVFDNSGRSFTSENDLKMLQKLILRVIKDIAGLDLIDY